MRRQDTDQGAGIYVMNDDLTMSFGGSSLPSVAYSKNNSYICSEDYNRINCSLTSVTMNTGDTIWTMRKQLSRLLPTNVGSGKLETSLSCDLRGNVAVIELNGALKEINNYYPYGGLMGGAVTGIQPDKYGGKELDRENGIDWYDSQARFYDPMIGRTTTIDPMSEKYYSVSPYVWCKSNPINRVDPNGMEDYYNLHGKYIYSEGDSQEKMLVISMKLEETDIRKAVQENKVIPVPNQEVIDAMNIIFDRSDNNSPNEHGFNVYPNNEIVRIVEGTPNGVDLTSIQSKVYDVHIHQWNGPNYQIGKATASTDDLKNKKTSKDNSVSIVLGYWSPKNIETGAKSTIGSSDSRSKEKKEIGFYTTKRLLTISFEEFKEIINKINEH